MRAEERTEWVPCGVGDRLYAELVDYEEHDDNGTTYAVLTLADLDALVEDGWTARRAPQRTVTMPIEWWNFYRSQDAALEDIEPGWEFYIVLREDGLCVTAFAA